MKTKKKLNTGTVKMSDVSTSTDGLKKKALVSSSVLAKGPTNAVALMDSNTKKKRIVNVCLCIHAVIIHSTFVGPVWCIVAYCISRSMYFI